MNHETYDSIIDRYVSGQMGADEERRFQELMKTDPELKRMFTAEMVLDRVLTRDRETLPAERPEAYAHFLGLLATSVPAAQIAQQAAGNSAGAGSTAGSTAGSAAGSGGSGIPAAISGSGAASGVAGTATGVATGVAAGAAKGTFLGALLAGGIAKVVAGAVVLVGLAVGTYVAVPALMHGGDQAVTGQPGGAPPAVVAPRVDQPALPAASAPSDAPAAAAQSETREMTAPENGASTQEAPATRQRESGIHSTTLKEAPARRQTERGSANEASPARARELESTTSATPSETVDPVRQLPRRLPHLKSDTVKASVSLKSKVNR